MIESLVGMATAGGISATLGATLSIVGKAVNLSHEAKKLTLARTEKEMAIVTKSMDDAANRTSGKGGIWIRRIIVISLFGFMFGLLSINGIIQHFVENGVPATYAYMEEVPSSWFGLVRAKSVLRTIPLYGIPVFSQAVNMMWLIATFYFGSSRIK